MDAQEARKILRALGEDDDGDRAFLPKAALQGLALEDVPDGVTFGVGEAKDGVVHVEWDGVMGRDGAALYGQAEYLITRKYWYSPLGLEQYMDLVRRAVETRHRTRGDVGTPELDDDGAYISLRFRIATSEINLRRAYESVRRIADELEEVADKATNEVGQRISEIAARLSGWGAETLDRLVDTVETASTADDKGRALEELCSQLFASVTGFTVAGRVRTETEEIDLSIVNGSHEARLRREGAIILAECKNWTGRCGKSEVVEFRSKIENRRGRCTLGVLISWNGFAGTVSKELLRDSRGLTLIVPMTGDDIREGVRTGDFLAILLKSWDRAVHA
jgi:hypothetical protein